MIWNGECSPISGSPASNPVNEPKDLAGKTLAVAPVNVISVEAMFRLNGIEPGTVKIVPYAYDPTPLIKGEIDASIDFTTNVPHTIQQSGPEAVSFLLYDFGFTIYNDTVVVSSDTLKSKRKELVAWLRASRRGWEENFTDSDGWPPRFADTWFKGTGRTIANEVFFNNAQRPLIESPAGIFAGLMVAFGLAILGEIRPAIARSLMPVALVSQTMPLVALTPLLVLLLGRGAAVTLAITVSVTFFPAYVTMAQGLQLVPRAAFDLTRAYGASWLQELYMVAIPSALPYVFAATRLAVPRALLGVMIAEWLATGVGLGDLLNQSRGYLDYGLIWAVAVVSVILSILFYQAVTMVERRVLARAGMWGR